MYMSFESQYATAAFSHNTSVTDDGRTTTTTTARLLFKYGRLKTETRHTR